MKRLLRPLVVLALTAIYQAVWAQALPSSNSSDLWLFVSNPSAGTTFAEDTGISVNSLMPPSSFVAGATLNTANSVNIYLVPSFALQIYIQQNGPNLEWAVEAAQFNGFARSNKPGGIIDITDNVQNPVLTAEMLLSNLETWSNGFQADIGYLDNNYVAGGQTCAFISGSAYGNVWGASSGEVGGSTNEYGQGPDQSGVYLGQSATLYGLTGNGNSGRVQSYVLATLVLNYNGILETPYYVAPQPPSSTDGPLPFWAIGALGAGLVGIASRRLTRAA